MPQKSLVRGLVSAVLVVVLCAPTSRASVMVDIGESVGSSELEETHTECFPSLGATRKLANFDYRQNGGQKYVVAVASFHTGCNEGRSESPKCSPSQAPLHPQSGRPSCTG